MVIPVWQYMHTDVVSDIDINIDNDTNTCT